MSPSAIRRLGRHERHVCLECRAQRTRFQYGGRVHADRDHNLCFRCFRAEMNRQRARRLNVRSAAPLKMDLAQSVKHARPRDLFAPA